MGRPHLFPCTMPHVRLSFLLLLVVALSACEVERRGDGTTLVRVASQDSTLDCGSFDIPPEDSASTRAIFAARRDTTFRPRRILATRSDTLVETGDVNPPSVEVEGLPPSPASAEPAAGLVIPVADIAPDELSDTFTDARGQGRVHNAIDIMAPRGVPVLAAAPGHVIRLFESERGGLTIYQLDPDGETVYYYAHLDAYQPGLEAGQTVQRGDTLGTVGDTGNAAPGNTHLHFAMWVVADSTQFWDGEPINPYPLLAGRGDTPSATGAQPSSPTP